MTQHISIGDQRRFSGEARLRGIRATSRVLCHALAVALAMAVFSPTTIFAQAGDKNTESKIEEGLYNCGKAKGKVSVSFKPDVELKDLITWAMGFTCKNFVFSSSIGGRSTKVTIIAPKKMTSRQAWGVFLVAIQTLNLTIVPQGNVLKIIESAQAKTEPLPLYSKGNPSATSQLVRIIIRPEHIAPEDLATALSALKSKDGAISSIPKAGILVVTDYGSVIGKMRTLVREIDQPVVGEQMYMIRVDHADATELAQKIQEILGTQNNKPNTSTKSTRSKRSKKSKSIDGVRLNSQSTSAAEVASALPSKIIADERTNSLIVLSSEAAYLRVRSLAKRLDVAIGGESEGRIHVYYLKNADAEEMSNTLTAVISGISQPSGSSGRTPRPRTSSTSRPATSGSSAPAFEGQVRITQDKPTNSLVIIASAKDFLSLRNVIEQLDTPRMQVFIEAVILEVQADNGRDLGASFHGGAGTDSGAVIVGGLQHNDLQSLNPASLVSSTGLLGGLLGPVLTEIEAIIPGASIPSFGVLFQAMATSSNVNVLSSPHILTTNNEEAEISVGENIPYQSSLAGFGGLGTGGTTGGIGFPTQSVQRQDVALTLKITPHINASDMVRLEIDQEISDIASLDFGGLGPSWSKRTIKTTVVVRDQQSIVIGGLMRDRVTSSESKVPLLGDVPLFGYLFKFTKKQKQKTNLLVMLTPYVIKDQMDIEQIVQRKVRERQEFMRSFSSFDRMKFEDKIDYRRKRGLIEEINRTVMSIERDIEILREAESGRQDFSDGLIEFDPNMEPTGKSRRNSTEDENVSNLDSRPPAPTANTTADTSENAANQTVSAKPSSKNARSTKAASSTTKTSNNPANKR